VTGRIGVAFRAVTGRRGSRAFFLGVIIVVMVSGLLAYAFERNQVGGNMDSLGDSLWWAVVTSTTVGYGDHSPLSVEARGVAVVLMLVGIGMLSVVTANVAAFFVESDDADTNRELMERLDRIELMLADLAARDNAATPDR
jgi:voltage-gated potassium channel